MEERIIYKTCVCCGQTRSEDNFRRLSRDEGKGVERETWTSKVCKICEKKGQPSKAARIENLSKLKQRFYENARAREKKEREKEYVKELVELGLTRHVRYTEDNI